MKGYDIEFEEHTSKNWGNNKRQWTRTPKIANESGISPFNLLEEVCFRHRFDN
ncbi:MAG: hypothetical protein UY04_C0063G0004 [Parcubacteria group bacterium GW2011_GWA2_47_7]|nr:MAG: hypothetical protein UY04_C0063G0004 [Parcubacteria group bacterium GW2011_GWA2_47_7]